MSNLKRKMLDINDVRELTKKAKERKNVTFVVAFLPEILDFVNDKIMNAADDGYEKVTISFENIANRRIKDMAKSVPVLFFVNALRDCLPGFGVCTHDTDSYNIDVMWDELN